MIKLILQIYDDKDTRCNCIYAITFTLHNGHLVNLATHATQPNTCLHGARATSISKLLHILHSNGFSGGEKIISFFLALEV